MSQKAGNIEGQEDKENSENQLKHVKTVADKTNYYNKNQEAAVSFLHQPSKKAVDDKGKESDFRKSKYDGVDARCMEIKSGSRDFGNPANQLIFADPKQTNAKDVSKSKNNENRSARKSGVSADDTTNVLCQLLKQKAAPDAEIDTFDGNQVNNFYFMALYKEAVENKVVDPKGRLTKLIKFTSGEVKELTQHRNQLADLIGYKQAISLMKRQYDNPQTIVAAYRMEIRKWPLIKSGDSAALEKFYCFSIKCQRITAGITWNALNTPDTMCSVLAKP